MKMADIKSRTWSKRAEIKTSAKTLMDIHKVICKEFGVDFYEDAFDVADAIDYGNIQICDDGIIVWMS